MRYYLRFRAKGLIPTVEVTVATLVAVKPLTYHYEVVKRIRGFTRSQAMARALEWAREHGDPR